MRRPSFQRELLAVNVRLDWCRLSVVLLEQPGQRDGSQTERTIATELTTSLGISWSGLIQQRIVFQST